MRRRAPRRRKRAVSAVAALTAMGVEETWMVRDVQAGTVQCGRVSSVRL